MQGQVLRVLDYSRNSRHLLVTAGDDGSVHLWDTTAKSPKVPESMVFCLCCTYSSVVQVL
jgi:WD40 repeat protein